MTKLPEGPYFDFPFTTNNTESTFPARISTDELAKLKDIPHQIEIVSKTFGNRASDVFNLGDRFRIYVLPEAGPGRPLIPDDSYIPEVIKRTAKELVDNSRRPDPAPIAEALTSQFFVNILRAASSKNPETCSPTTFNDASGTHVIPTLSPTAFVQPSKPSVRSRTGLMQITGVTCSARGRLTILLTKDHLEVSLTPDLETIVGTLTFSVIREGLWFSGTIFQGDKNRWVAAEDGRISHQRSIADQSADG